MILSVIILSYNTQKLLKDCLDSIQTSLKNGKLGQKEVEIIVVDNDSTDSTRKYLKTLSWPNLKIILNEDNLGFAQGNNQGLAVAGGKYVMLLNSDTLILDQALDKMVNFMETNPGVDGLSPLLLNADGSAQVDYYMRFPNLAQVFGYHNRLFRPLFMNTALVGLICFAPQKKPYLVDQLPGAAMLVRKRVWQEVGLLDEDYPFYFEDVDWSWQAKKKGKKLLVLPTAKITHLGGGSWKKASRRPEKYYQQFFTSMKIFVRKNYTPIRRIVLVGGINFHWNIRIFFKNLLGLSRD